MAAFNVQEEDLSVLVLHAGGEDLQERSASQEHFSQPDSPALQPQLLRDWLNAVD